MDMPLRCVHALCPFMWYYGKGVVASCLGYNWHRIQEVLHAYWHDMGGFFSCNHTCMNATLEVVLQHYRHSSCMGSVFIPVIISLLFNYVLWSQVEPMLSQVMAAIMILYSILPLPIDPAKYWCFYTLHCCIVNSWILWEIISVNKHLQLQTPGVYISPWCCHEWWTECRQ